MLRLAALALLTLGSACARPREEARAPAADSLAPAVIAWKFTPPAVWGDRTRSVAIDPAERSARYAGARAVERFDYFPRDTTIPPQPLLLIAAWDSAAWAARPVEAARDSEIIAQGRGVVYVAAIPRGNPFPDGSEEAREFAARLLPIEAVRRAFQIVSSS